MDLSLLVSVLGGLGLVLLLLGVAYRAVRGAGLSPVAGGSGPVEMEVLGRVGVAPKQGVALIRVEDRLLLVSVGEGGVRRVGELGSPTREEVLERHAAPLEEAGEPGWMAQLRDATRAFVAVGATAAALAAGPLLAPAPLAAQDGGGAAGADAVAGRTAGDAAESGSVGGDAVGADADGTDDGLGAATLETLLQAGLGEDGESEGEGSGLDLDGPVGTVVFLGILAILPTLVLMMTSFTRILIVLHFLRQALGTQTAPPGHLIAALAILLTGFVMAPTLQDVNERAVHPWVEGEIAQVEMLDRAEEPFRDFMLDQTRSSDLSQFVEIAGASGAQQRPESADDVSLVVLASAFVTSELRTAFQIGFALFLPFVVIDLVVASVLMSMGMFMLPPVMVSLPFKLLLFVLVDGWSLVVQGVTASF